MGVFIGEVEWPRYRVMIWTTKGQPTTGDVVSFRRCSKEKIMVILGFTGTDEKGMFASYKRIQKFVYVYLCQVNGKQIDTLDEIKKFKINLLLSVFGEMVAVHFDEDGEEVEDNPEKNLPTG